MNSVPMAHRIVLGIGLGTGLAFRFWLLLTDDGLHWPDEIFQTLEPAHRLAFGYGLLAWELVEGARSLALPGLLAAVLRVTALVSDRPEAYLIVVRMLFTAGGLATAFGVFRLARACGAEPMPAAAAGATCALLGLGIFYGHRAMSETAAAVPAVFGMALALDRDQRRRRVLIGASLLGVAVLFRLQSALLCVGTLAGLVAMRRWRTARDVTLALAAWALLYGLLDRLTWGGWFHSARVYLSFNVVGSGAEQFGVLGPDFYRVVLYRALGPVIVLLGLLALASIRRAPALVLSAGAFLAAHALAPHKELRFLWPALPVLCAAAGVGLEELRALRALRVRWASRGSAALMAALLASAAWSAVRVPRLTDWELGLFDVYGRRVAAFDDGGAENRLLLVAHRRADLCGLAVWTRPLGYTGGYSYLHRRVPLYERDGPAGAFNYAIVPEPDAEGEVIARDRGVALMRLSGGPCAPDPGFDGRLR